jgi:hypothetical protein
MTLGWLGLGCALTGCPGGDDDGDTTGGASGYGRWEEAVALDADEGALLSVWGRSDADVWAVGGQLAAVGEPGVGLLMHSDGTAWTTEALPAGTPLLNWVHGADGEIWLVGNAGAALQRGPTGWTSVPTPVDVPLWGVFVLAADDAWAVGGDAFDLEGTPVILRWDGASWTDSPLPALDRASAALFKVWAAATDDVWAVGDSGVIVHFDGMAWTQVPSGTSHDLISLWGTGPSDIVAVGGRSAGTVARYDGATWSTFDVQLPGLNGVWVDTDGAATIVGNRGAAAVLAAGSAELDDDPTPAELMVLHAVFGFASGRRVSVGGSLDRTPPYVGLILEAP